MLGKALSLTIMHKKPYHLPQAQRW